MRASTPRDPAAGRAVPRPVRRGHPQAHVPDHRRRRGRGALPAARPHHPGVARLSRLAGGRQARRLLLSRPGVPPPRRRRRPNSCRPASNRSAAPTPPRPMPRCSRSASRRRAHYGLAAPEIRIGDVGLFAALVAALDLAPAWKRRLVKDFNRKTERWRTISTGWRVSAAKARAGVSGRARGAGRLRPEGGARARHRPALDRRHQRRRRPLGRRDRRPLPRTGRARRAARGCRSEIARADRALPRRSPAIRTSAAAELRALAADAKLDARRRARPVREPHRLPRRARRRRRRASASRPRSAAASTTTPASCSSCTIRPARRRPAGRRRPLRRPADAARQRRRRSRRSASRSGSSGSPRCGGAA